MNNNNNPQGDNNQPKMPKFNMNWLYGLIIVTLAMLFFTGGGNALLSGSGSSTNARYSDFQAYVNRGWAKSVVIN